MSEKEKEILDLAFEAFDSGSEYCQIKMPPSSRIHELNMALNSLEKLGYITILKRNMTEIRLELTERGLESFL